MAGPTCFVLSPTALEADEILKELVRMVGNESDGESFWVRDTRGIGGIYAGEGRPFILFSEPRDADELSAITAVVGWTPLQEIGLAAMCNDAKDHRILAEMALWLSDRLSGVVDLNGEIPFISALGRQSARVGDQAFLGGNAACSSIASPDGLRAWLANAGFRMVK